MHTVASDICAYGISYILTYVAEQASRVVWFGCYCTYVDSLFDAGADNTPITRLTWLSEGLRVADVIMCFCLT